MDGCIGRKAGRKLFSSASGWTYAGIPFALVIQERISPLLYIPFTPLANIIYSIRHVPLQYCKVFYRIEYRE